ncbi:MULTISPECIES: DUF2147 domain-containing protein [unclassified Acinetobacter]|uniref:DUF2147 domain-containing protein n=1 Tax=unclassified Acinetobacter TaxID=196816 RepID=UPI0035B6C4C6
MKKLSTGLVAAGLLAVSSLCFADNDIAGKWVTIDDATGFKKAVVEIKKDGNGVYSGTIIQILPRPNYVPKALCDNCAGALKGKPILGMTILNGMKKSATRENTYEGGTVVDPLSGKVYKSTIRNTTANRLTLRGFVGFEALGRNQTWIRQ